MPSDALDNSQHRGPVALQARGLAQCLAVVTVLRTCSTAPPRTRPSSTTGAMPPSTPGKKLNSTHSVKNGTPVHIRNLRRCIGA